MAVPQVMFTSRKGAKAQRRAQVLTLVVLAGLGGVLVYRQRPAATGRGGEASPESTIWRMLEASRASDPNRYLNCFTGDLERRLEKNLQEMGRERFDESLANALRRVKGVAVKAPQMISDTEGLVSVEYVYEDGNEVQQVYLRRVGAEWKIYRVDGAERARALVPYGTPVTE